MKGLHADKKEEEKQKGDSSAPPAVAVASISGQSKEEIEQRRARAELERRNIERTNKVARMLGGVRYVIEEHSFEFLVLDGQPLRVSEYFPEAKIAVDKFHDMSDVDEKVIAFKKKMFKKHKIKYGHLTPVRSLADLHEELDL